MSPTIYFGYGSNLWLHQMRTRCPSSTYLGVARLSNYRWIINERGYANVVEITSPSPKDVVYGLVFSLLPSDESALDINEGVPHAYTKELLPCSFWASPNSQPVDVSQPPTEEAREMLVYIDRKRVGVAEPREEYVVRMNKGIEDAFRMGVPRGYVEGAMRKFIPPEEKGEEDMGEVQAKALRQAGRFEDESGVMPVDGE